LIAKLDAPAVNATDKLPSPGVMDVIDGADGVTYGVKTGDRAQILEPAALFALTRKVYAVVFVSPVTSNEVDVAVSVAVVQREYGETEY
jgi:hypothetical protein